MAGLCTRTMNKWLEIFQTDWDQESLEIDVYKLVSPTVAVKKITLIKGN